MDGADRVIDVAEAAKLLKCSKRRAADLMLAGEIASQKPGKRRVTTEGAVLDYLRKVKR